VLLHEKSCSRQLTSETDNGSYGASEGVVSVNRRFIRLGVPA